MTGGLLLQYWLGYNFGGMITSTIHVLVLIPVFFAA
jgi:multidrug efflux pump subunit AcrB